MSGINVVCERRMKMKHKATISLLILFAIILITIPFFQKVFDGGCMCGASHGSCPCPNNDYVHEVSDYHGYKPSGAGSWEYMCRTYKEDQNKTFNCFE